MNSTQHFSPEDFNLEQYNLYFKDFKKFNVSMSGFENNEIILTFVSYGNPIEGLKSLSNDLKLVDKIHRATHSNNQAVKKHLEELELLLELSNDTK